MRVGLVLVAAALLCGAPALAAPPRTDTAAAAEAGSAQRWLAELAEWSMPFNPIILENVAVLGFIADGANTAAEFHDKRDRKGGRAWFATWSTEAKAKLERLEASRTRLPTTPPPLPPGVPATESLRALVEGLPEAARAVNGLVAKSAASGRRYLDVIEKTVTGSEAARAELATLGLQNTIMLLQGENSYTEIGKLLVGSNHPQHSLASASIHSNRGVIVLLEYRLAHVRGEEPDAKSYAARVRAEADAEAADARAVAANAKAVLASFGSGPEGATPVVKVVAEAMATYEASAETEAAIADKLRRIADGVERGESLDEGPVMAATAALSELVLKRATLDTRRREILAGKP